MYTVVPFDENQANDSDYQTALTFSNIMHAEMFPDDPLRTLEVLKKNWQSRNRNFFEKEDERLWYLVQDNQHIAHLWTDVWHYEDNRHLMNIELMVHPNFRRKGLAKLLLTKALEIAEHENRTHILSWVQSTIPAGSEMANHLGAKLALGGHTNQLVLENLDRPLILSWIEQAKHTAKDFSLGFWLGGYPEDEIQAIAEMYNVMNTAPRGELAIEDHKVKPEVIRQNEAFNKTNNIQRWVAYARHKLSGNLAGYSETFYQPEDNDLLVRQGDTGVLPNYRGHGLGKWLKAVMLKKILLEHPQVKFIRTGNADSNAHMLAINHALGFKPYIGWANWQLETHQLRSYLEK